MALENASWEVLRDQIKKLAERLSDTANNNPALRDYVDLAEYILTTQITPKDLRLVELTSQVKELESLLRSVRTVCGRYGDDTDWIALDFDIASRHIDNITSKRYTVKSPVPLSSPGELPADNVLAAGGGVLTHPLLVFSWEQDSTTTVKHTATTPIGEFVITEPYESIHLFTVKHNGREIAALETFEECQTYLSGYVKRQAAFYVNALQFDCVHDIYKRG